MQRCVVVTFHLFVTVDFDDDETCFPRFVARNRSADGGRRQSTITPLTTHDTKL